MEELAAFKAKYGHVNVPQQPTKQIPEHYTRLAVFCRNMRSQYRFLQRDDTMHLSFLTKERVARLEEMGFIWNAQKAGWHQQYQNLVAFSERYGHTNVPRHVEEHRKLANWVSHQRQQYYANQHRRSQKKFTTTPLDPEKVALLERIGFQWDPKDDKWWELYQELKAFGIDNGHYDIPGRSGTNPRLYKWLASIRKQCRDYVLSVSIEGTTEGVHVSGLNPKRLNALREIGFCWLPDTTGRLVVEPPENIFAPQYTVPKRITNMTTISAANDVEHGEGSFLQ